MRRQPGLLVIEANRKEHFKERKGLQCYMQERSSKRAGKYPLGLKLIAGSLFLVT